MGETTVGVRTTSRAFGAWLDDALGRYRVDRHAEPEYSIVIEGAGEGCGRRFNVLYQGVGVVSRALDAGVVARSFLSELEAKLLRDRDDALYLHYGLGRSGGSAVMIPAWLVAFLSGTGRRLSKAGISLPVARWVRLDLDTAEATPSPPLLGVEETVLANVPGRRTSGADAYEELRAPTPIGGIVTYDEILDTIAAAPRGRTVYRLAQSAANLGAVGGRGMEVLAAVVERAHCFETGLGRPQQMLAALEAVFAHERAHSVMGSPA